jgi:hypothetical protein
MPSDAVEDAAVVDAALSLAVGATITVRAGVDVRPLFLRRKSSQRVFAGHRFIPHISSESERAAQAG